MTLPLLPAGDEVAQGILSFSTKFWSLLGLYQQSIFSILPPRPEIVNVRLPHVQQPQQQVKSMGRGRGKLLSMAATSDNLPPSPKNDFVPTKDDRTRATQQNKSGPPIQKFNPSLQFVQEAYYKKPPNQQEPSTSVQKYVYDMKEDFPALR